MDALGENRFSNVIGKEDKIKKKYRNLIIQGLIENFKGVYDEYFC